MTTKVVTSALELNIMEAVTADTGTRTDKITSLCSQNQYMPTGALLRGFALYSFAAKRDPWVVVNADDQVMRLWDTPPSLTDLYEATDVVEQMC